jgi:hypothetical protein
MSKQISKARVILEAFAGGERLKPRGTLTS